MKRLLILIACVALLFVGCAQSEKIIVDTPTLTVTLKGAEISVYDIVGQNEYHYRIALVKRSKARSETRKAVDTETLKITQLPHGGFEIVDRTAGRVYKLRPRRIFGGYK